MLYRVRHESITVVVKRHFEADRKVEVLSEFACRNIWIARVYGKHERLARVELKAELLDLRQRRDLHIGDDSLNR